MQLNLMLNQTQKLMMTPKLQEAIAILQLSREELCEKINDELLSNPVFETGEIIADEDKFDTGQLRKMVASFTSYRDSWSGDEPAEMAREKSLSGRELYPSLQDYLLHQIKCIYTDEMTVKIGTELVLRMDENGYLQGDIDEIAQDLGIKAKQVHAVLMLVQGLDPPGVGARNLEECLLIQYRQLAGPEEKMAAVVIPIIKNYLQDVADYQYKKISKELKVFLEDVRYAVEMIKSLNPKPGNIFINQNDVVEYVVPDLTVREIDGKFIVLSEQNEYPRLKISVYYKQLLMESNDTGDEVCQYIKERLQSALWLVKSIEQRQLTIRRVMESIVAHQIEFFRNGPSGLCPLTQREIAEDIGIHESTVSRAVAKKYVQTSWGIFEMKYFFTGGFCTNRGQEISSEVLKEMVKNIINNEDHLKPYSDQKIADILLKKGIDISRRTIAKYRDELNIVSSGKRKRCF